jgi:hypothetical protein
MYQLNFSIDFFTQQKQKKKLQRFSNFKSMASFFFVQITFSSFVIQCQETLRSFAISPVLEEMQHENELEIGNQRHECMNGFSSEVLEWKNRRLGND